MTTPDSCPVLELRVHGVNNASPASMLNRPECHIEQVDGDKLGSFWRIKPDRRDDRAPGRDGERPEEGYVPDGVTREAYSWGGMARTSPGVAGTGRASMAANLVGRVGWALLLPFGLTNVAYWSRQLPTGGEGAAGWWGRRAAVVRAFGLGLTVLLVSTVCEVAFDLFAVQCYPEGELTCFTSPKWLPLENTGVSTRLGWASVVPVLVLLVLWVLTEKSRVRYEAVNGTSRDLSSARMLARTGLWQGGAMVRGLTRLHLAAGLAVTVLASAWPALFGTGTGTACGVAANLLSADCRAQVVGAPTWWAFGGVVVCAFALLGGALWFARTQDGPDLAASPDPSATPDGHTRSGSVGTTWMLVAAVLLFGINVALLIGAKPPIAERVSLLGVNATPTVVVAVLLGIVASALAWRSSRAVLPCVVGVFVAGGLLAMYVLPQVWFAGAVAVLGGFVVPLVLRRRVDGLTQRDTAWSGAAPGVLLGLALLVALTLSTLVVIGVGNWLNGPTPSSALVCGGGSSMAAEARMCVAVPYVWFGAGTLVVLTLVGFVGAALGILALMRRRRPLPEGEDPPAAEVLAARHTAALAHRAERVTGLLAGLGLSMAVVAVAGPAVPDAIWPSWLLDGGQFLATRAALWAGLAATVLVGAFVGSGALRGSRPLGLVWDLICFLPRAAHPFAPPCYAERAVPELARRVRRWLDGPPGRTVVLSAHSLGAVLAVAVVFVLDERYLKSVRLITYGVQLRAYFGRIFPELLGPDVLGSAPCAAPAWLRTDPWRNQSTGPTPPAEAPDSVRSRLDGRWINLWRRTDYLGFPALGYVPNPVDRFADEVLDPTAADPRVQTHSGYPSTSSYDDALRALTAPVGGGPPTDRPGQLASQT